MSAVMAGMAIYLGAAIVSLRPQARQRRLRNLL
jgi:hypothetical protein